MRRGRRRALALAAIACAVTPLGGCASIVFVHTDGQPVAVRFGLGVPRIDRGANEAVAVRRLGVGIYGACGAVGVGLQRCEEFRVDVRTCGVGLVEIDPQHPADRRALVALADRVRAECARGEPKETNP